MNNLTATTPHTLGTAMQRLDYATMWLRSHPGETTDLAVLVTWLCDLRDALARLQEPVALQRVLMTRLATSRAR